MEGNLFKNTVLDLDELKKNLYEFRNRMCDLKENIDNSTDRNRLYKEATCFLIDLVFISICEFKKNNMFTVFDEFGDVQFSRFKEAINKLNQDNLFFECLNDLEQDIKLMLYSFYSCKETNIKDFINILESLVEDIGEKKIGSVRCNKTNSSKERRDNGSYYTNMKLVDIVVKQTMDLFLHGKSQKEVMKIKIIDPAVGSGKFLISTYRYLIEYLNRNEQYTEEEIEKIKVNIAKNCLFGVDLNKAALKAARYSLWLEVNTATLGVEDLEKNFVEGDSILSRKTKKGNKYESCAHYYFIGEIMRGNKTIKYEKILEQMLEESDFNGNWIEKYQTSIDMGKKTKAFIWNEKFREVFDENGGFDVIIGNPPWNKVKVHMKEFFEHYDVSIKNLQGNSLKKYVENKFLSQKKFSVLWDKYNQECKAYGSCLGFMDMYDHQTFVIDNRIVKGDKELYKYFIEQSYNIINNRGYVGLILPATLIQSEGTTGLRKLLLEKTTLELMMTVENRDRIFPIDSRFKYLLLIFTNSISKKNDIKCKFMVKNVDELQKIILNKEFIELDREFIEKVSPLYKTFPEVKNNLEKEIIQKIYLKFPLINSENGWKIEFNRELDMTNDSHLFIHCNNVDKKRTYVPLYEGRMVHQFDYSSKRYLEGEGRKAKWEIIDWNNKEVLPHYYVNVQDVERKQINYQCIRPCYCDIAGQTNERSIQTTLLPKNIVAGNKVPTVDIYPKTIVNDLLWVAITNSFVFDWLMRQRITTTVNFFHWNQVPLPRVDINESSIKKLIYNATKLSMITRDMEVISKEVNDYYGVSENMGPIDLCIDPQERQQLRAEIDAIVGEIYNLNFIELKYIIEQFPLIDRKQAPILNERKSTITRDLILLNFLQRLNDKSQDYIIIKNRVEIAQEQGSIAYIPG